MGTCVVDGCTSEGEATLKGIPGNATVCYDHFEKVDDYEFRHYSDGRTVGVLKSD